MYLHFIEIVLSLVLVLLTAVSISKIFLIRGKIHLSVEVMQRLLSLAQRSLETLDVPVASVLLYENAVIGEGYNTVQRNMKAGEHAEINAISDAIAKLGFDQFSKLNRRRLCLVSTFEPCTMCLGACINYNIHHVFFLQGKDVSELLKEKKANVQYLLNRKLVKNNGEQIQLFSLHPKYPKK